MNKKKDKNDLLNQIDYGNGPTSLQEKALKLCYEFSDIIDDTLGSQPAKVDAPMDIDIDEKADGLIILATEDLRVYKVLRSSMKFGGKSIK